MLIDFTVENYRSIKDPVTLSAVAQPGRSTDKPQDSAGRRRIKSDSEIAPSAPVPGRDFELLPVLAIFGPNASGKSNVLRALNELLGFMTWGAREEISSNSLRRFIPFRLDQKTARGLTRFQVRFAIDGEIFIYRLALDQSRIHHERLERIPHPPKRVPKKPIFERLWSEADQEYVWINGVGLGSAYQEMQSTLRDHEPFISFLVSRLKVVVVKPLADWLSDRWPGWVMEACESFAPHALFNGPPEKLAAVEKLIRQLDTRITRIEVVKNDAPSHNIDSYDDVVEYRVAVWHDTPDGPVRWSLNEESTGTQRLFAFALFVLECLKDGSLLAMDELSASIHPLISRRLVRMFQSAKTNPRRAQLIFTSHDNTLQRNNLLRRDQTWFTDKRRDGSTELYSLTDFHPRNDLAIDKAYLDGRFGAVPFLEELEEEEPAGVGS